MERPEYVMKHGHHRKPGDVNFLHVGMALGDERGLTKINKSNLSHVKNTMVEYPLGPTWGYCTLVHWGFLEPISE